MMTLFMKCGLYKEVYDTNKVYDITRSISLNHLPSKSSTTSRLPESVLYKMYKHVNFNKPINIAFYHRTMKKIEQLTDFKIYIDYWSNFKKIIICDDAKIVFIANMYY